MQPSWIIHWVEWEKFLIFCENFLLPSYPHHISGTADLSRFTLSLYSFPGKPDDNLWITGPFSLVICGMNGHMWKLARGLFRRAARFVLHSAHEAVCACGAEAVPRCSKGICVLKCFQWKNATFEPRRKMLCMNSSERKRKHSCTRIVMRRK